MFYQVGIMGLVEEEWIETLATLDPEDVTYLDFVSKGNELCQSLKEKVTGHTFVIYFLDFLEHLSLMFRRNPIESKLVKGINCILTRV